MAIVVLLYNCRSRFARWSSTGRSYGVPSLSDQFSKNHDEQL
jgi:hypothetical protein